MFEWKTWETGAAQFHTRLRFPGQYHDWETEQYENWNRYYDPTLGRYLSPEPLLQDPVWLRSQATDGIASPTYAYAGNNPARNVDPNGLQIAETMTLSAALPSVNSLLGPGYASLPLMAMIYTQSNEIGTFPDPGAGIKNPDLGPVIPFVGPTCAPNATPMSAPGERNKERKNPNADKEKKRDHQTGKKLPPKPPPQKPLEVPLVKPKGGGK